MHLVLLGVVKKFLVNTWCFGIPPHKLRSSDFDILSSKLLSLSSYIPSEFARKPRPLSECKRYKATEFRQILLYTAPMVLKNMLPIEKYNHFITLHVAITILVSEKYCNTFLNYAEKLLYHFVEVTKIIYDQHYLSHNVHNLLHLVDDVRKFGPLDSFSNFGSENFLQYLKNLLKNSHRPLQQIIKRIMENVYGETDKLSTEIIYKKTFKDGALTDNCTSPQYKRVIFPKFILSSSNPNNCCQLQDGSIITIINFARNKQSKNVCVIGYELEKKDDLYSSPCKSSILNIFYCEYSVTPILKTWPISSIRNKCVFTI